MHRKINILIITSIIALLALSGIQAYLIHNTYQLKKKAFLAETKKVISKIDDETPVIDSLETVWSEKFLGLLAKYKMKSISKDSIMNSLKLIAESANPHFVEAYNKEVKKVGLEYDIQYQKNILNIAIVDSTGIDTIFPTRQEEGMFFIGEDFPKENGYLISTATWNSSFQSDGSEEDLAQIPLEFEFVVKTQDLMNIADWQRIVFGRMTALFVSSLLLFLFVIGLLFYSISALIKQKKVTDIKTDFINNITHELKTPLATLSIASKSLRTDTVVQSPKALNSTLDIIDRQNSRLQKLIDQVMSNSLGAEKMTLQKEPTEASVYLRQMLQDFELSIKEKNVAVKADISPEKAELQIDRFLLTTALHNILENAVKYGGDEKSIEISSQFNAKEYLISIKDHGIGISSKNLKEVFEKFYRVTDGDRHDVKGLGLGLYYANQIVKAHNGHISAQSEVGQGTEFIISIPLNV